MQQRNRGMWAKLTKDSPWEHFLVVEAVHYRNGTQVEPYDFWEVHRTAFMVDEVVDRTIEVFDDADLRCTRRL